MAKQYIVGIVHTSLSHFSVVADSESEAEQLARVEFSESGDEVMLGNEFDTIDRIFIDEQ